MTTNRARALWRRIKERIEESNRLIAELCAHPDFDPLDPEFGALRKMLQERVRVMHDVSYKLTKKYGSGPWTE